MSQKSKERAPANESALSETTNQPTDDSSIFAQMLDDLKRRMLNGERVQACDYPLDLRPYFHAVIAPLRDQLPVRKYWRTKTESALGDWHLRPLCYGLPAELVTKPKGGEV